MSNPAPPKTLAKKKQPIVYKAKVTGAEVPKAKTLITLSKTLKKTPAKAQKKR